MGANAKSHAKYIKTIRDKTSWHITVDDKCAYQHIPFEEKAYATDNLAANNTSIHIEICENIDGNLLKATDNAVLIVAKLCRDFDIDEIKTHQMWTGKQCPDRLLNGDPYSFNTFVSKVKENI